MKSPLEDTIWGASYGSVAAVQAAFDRFGPEYHEAIMASGAPALAARAVMPYLNADAQGIDFGCGSGVLGLALRDAGLRQPLDGIDLSPTMLDLARATGCYRHLHRANLLAPPDPAAPPPVWLANSPYDFAITVGLIGDYIPYYHALPQILATLRPNAILAYAVERRSTPAYALESLSAALGLTLLTETTLPIPQGKLEAQTYHFFITRVPAPSS